MARFPKLKRPIVPPQLKQNDYLKMGFTRAQARQLLHVAANPPTGITVCLCMTHRKKGKLTTERGIREWFSKHVGCITTMHLKVRAEIANTEGGSPDFQQPDRIDPAFVGTSWWNRVQAEQQALDLQLRLRSLTRLTRRG